MAAKKKTRKKKATRKVSEASYDVTMTKDNVGTSQDDTKTVNAPDAEQAVKAAQKDDPRKGSYDKVEVKKGGASSRVRTKPDTVSNTQSRTQGMAGFESIDYPYNVGLPGGFARLTERFPKTLRESLAISSRFGRLYIQVPSAEVMEVFMTKLDELSRGRTADKSLATVITEGIRRNIK